MKVVRFPQIVMMTFFAFSWLTLIGLNVQAAKQDYTALYRLYNAQNNDHFYTTSCDEKNTALSGGYIYEHVTGYVASRQLRRTVPLYRFLLSNGEHFYTTSNEEMTNLSRIAGNKFEGITGYLADNSQRNTTPLYRLASSDRHLYTANEQEKTNYLQNAGNKSEGITGYIWTSGTNSCGDNGNLPPNTGSFPIVYAQSNFQGPAEAVERDWESRKDWSGSPHLVRSIHVPAGWYLVLYDKSKFRGKSYNLNSDWSPQPGDYWNGRIRSIKVYQGTPPRQPR